MQDQLHRQNSLLYKIFYNALRFVNDRFLRFALWKTHISVVPPHFIKFRIIKEYKNRLNLNIIIETGTYLGDTIDKGKHCFKEIYSIELNDYLFNKARTKYSRFDNIHIIKGDSVKALPEIVAKLSKAALFWLDAHYSGGITGGNVELSPIVKEVECILKQHEHGHVLLIDDANMFIGEKGYPNIEFLKELIHKYRPGWLIYTKNNIIRAHKNMLIKA